MNINSAGPRKEKLLSREECLSPFPLPTGEQPEDVLGNIWRKNEVYLDVGTYAVGSVVMSLWPMLILVSVGAYFEWGGRFFYIYAIGSILIIGLPVLMFVYVLLRPTSNPARFNRQRREVCVPVNEHDYWIVPWETVIAQATEHQSFSQAGKYSVGGGLVVGFKNPDPHAEDELKYCSFTFACGSVTASRRVWECMRSYMEIGPEAIEDFREKSHHPKGVLATYWDQLLESAQRKGWPMALLWEGFFGLFIFNILLIIALERWKLNPPPDLTYPDIIEWSKPLPPQQWAKRSPELEAAIAQREAELAAQKNL